MSSSRAAAVDGLALRPVLGVPDVLEDPVEAALFLGHDAFELGVGFAVDRGEFLRHRTWPVVHCAGFGARRARGLE
jgi:hypothetical protein